MDIKDNQIIVFVKCLVYNHEPFLRQCLDGLVMQKTNFWFEAIVHDDASTDNSAAIIKEYAEKYPDIIKPIYEDENQYSKKNGTLAKIINKAISPSAKYIAICEGDDYWTDPLKLQKQVDFLESHPDYVICSHDFIRFNQSKKELQRESAYHYLFTSKKDNKDFFTYTLDDYFNGWWTHPLTCIYRNKDYHEKIPRKKYKNFRDDIFFYYVIKEGKGALLPDVMGIYRIHDAGMWSRSNYIEKKEASMYNAYNIYTVEHDKRAFRKILRIQSEVLSRLWKNGNKRDFYLKLKDYFRMDPFPFPYKLIGKLVFYHMVAFKHKLINTVK